MDHPEKNPLARRGHGVSPTLHGRGSEVERLPWIPEINGLMRHGAKHVTGHRRIVSLGR